jgi:biotin carboxyl carrier protein
MRYFVKLDDQEFSLVLRGHNSEQATLGGPDGASMLTQILSPARHGRPALVSVDGQMFRVFLAAPGLANAVGRAVPLAERASINGHNLSVSIETELERRVHPIRHTSAARETRILAPMPGRIVKVSVRQGDVVSSGAPLLSIEAMKMENELHARCAGRITKLGVQAGDTVDGDQELIVIEPE